MRAELITQAERRMAKLELSELTNVLAHDNTTRDQFRRLSSQMAKNPLGRKAVQLQLALAESQDVAELHAKIVAARGVVLDPQLIALAERRRAELLLREAMSLPPAMVSTAILAL